MERTDRFGRRWARGMGALALAGGLLAAPVVGQAQEVRDCRCVDRDGNEIENCRCLKSLELGDLEIFGLGTGLARRAQIGVWINYDQGGELDGLGARVDRVQEDGPADEAGLREGDVVVRVAGHSVFDPLEDEDAEESLDPDRSTPVQRFVRLVGSLEPEEAVEFEVMRDGVRTTLTLTPERARSVRILGGEGLDLPALDLFGVEGNRLRLNLGELGIGARLNELRLNELRLNELRLNTEEMRARLDTLRKEGWAEERPGVFRFEGPGERGRVRVFADSLPGSGEWGILSELRPDPCFRLHSGDRAWVFAGDDCVDGVEFVELNPELGEYFGSDRGVLVAEVAEGSALGLRPGDVLLGIDGREVSSPEQARRILASYQPDEELRLRILRKGSEKEVLGQRR
jgi:membrane-associated protease RseP (regulator of RpoE activity)